MKTVELTTDFMRVESFKFLCTIIYKDLKWNININRITKKTQQRMFLLRQLKMLDPVLRYRRPVHPHIILQCLQPNRTFRGCGTSFPQLMTPSAANPAALLQGPTRASVITAPTHPILDTDSFNFFPQERDRDP